MKKLVTAICLLCSQSVFAGHSTYLDIAIKNQTDQKLKFKVHNHDTSGGSWIHTHGKGDYTFEISAGSSEDAQLHVWSDTFASPGDMHFYPENSGDSGGMVLEVVCSNSDTYNPDVVGNTELPPIGSQPSPYKGACNSGKSDAPSVERWFLVFNGWDYKSKDNNYCFTAIHGSDVVTYGVTAIPLHTTKSEAARDDKVVFYYAANPDPSKPCKNAP